MNAPFVPEITANRTAALGTGAPSVYRPSQRSSPVALLLSALLVGGLVSSVMLTRMVTVRKAEPRTVVVNLMQPPAPPPEVLEPPPERQVEDQVQPQVTAPLPQVALPLPEAPPVVAAPPPPVALPPAPKVAPAEPVQTGPVDAGDLTGRLLSAKPPSYPVESRRLREQGTVILAVLLTPGGTVDEISVARSSGHDRLDRAALKAVRDWRWTPFKRDGSLVAVRGQVTIPFVLKS